MFQIRELKLRINAFHGTKYVALSFPQYWHANETSSKILLNNVLTFSLIFFFLLQPLSCLSFQAWFT